MNDSLKIDTFEAAEKHLERARPVLAAVYNENLTRYDWHAPEPDELTCYQTVHVKLEQEVHRLQQKVAHLEGQMAVADLDPNDLQDLQETIMDVDDEIEMALPDQVNEDNDLDMDGANGSEHFSLNEQSVTNIGNSITDEINNSHDNNSINVNGCVDNSTPNVQSLTNIDNSVAAAINNSHGNNSVNANGCDDNSISNEQSLVAADDNVSSIFDSVAGYTHFDLDVSINYMKKNLRNVM